MKNIIKFIFLIHFFIIIVIINYEFFFYNFFLKRNNKKLKKKKILIEIDISRTKRRRGPEIFIEGINDILPYNANDCLFIASKSISPINGENKSDFFFIPFPKLNEKIYKKWCIIKKINKLILGPIFVPRYWNSFPNKHFWKERKFKEIITKVKGIAVHSNRVLKYLSQKSNTNDFIKKYIIIRPCSNLKPKNVKPFNKRKIDILFFEKYRDLDHRKQGTSILKLFKNSSKKVKKIKYGRYTKEKMKILANNSKFIIYFSFFDTGAIGLKEIQNFGVLAFSHQKDLVINKETTFFVPELANKYNMNIAYHIIMKKIKILSQLGPNTTLIAKKNQDINKCQNALQDLCKSLI